MGSFYTNYQVRSDSMPAVIKAMGPLVHARAYVSPPSGGWGPKVAQETTRSAQPERSGR